MKKLNRFTTLPVLLDMLSRKKLLLLDPSTWEDKNDSEILFEYRKRKKLGALLALCFSQGDETIHHWKAFADGISGCCVEFDAPSLLVLFNSIADLRFGPVKYRKLGELSTGTIDLEDMPFTKRWPYRCEEEFRVIWESQLAATHFEIDFDLQIIRRITISQRMPDRVYATIRDHLKDVSSDPEQRINRSTIYRNDLWIDKFKQA